MDNLWEGSERMTDVVHGDRADIYPLARLKKTAYVAVPRTMGDLREIVGEFVSIPNEARIEYESLDLEDPDLGIFWEEIHPVVKDALALAAKGRS